MREQALGQRMSCTHRQYAGAIGILRTFLGKDWLDRVHRDAGTFLRPLQHTAIDAYKRQDRAVDLAELLLNLSDVEGWDARVDSLRTSDVETALSELEGARLLHVHGYSFRFVRPSGHRGHDFDVEAQIDDQLIPCEMKAKLERGKPTPTSVRDTLAKARSQLPKSTPGVVFMKVPESWTTDVVAADAIKSGVRDALRNSTRLHVVFVHWEEWRLLSEAKTSDGAVRAARVRPFPNSVVDPRVATLIDRIEGPSQSFAPWTSLQRILCEKADIARLDAMAEGN